MPNNFNRVRSAHQEQGLEKMGKLLYSEWVTEARAAVRDAGLSREQYMPRVLRIAEDLIVDQKLEYIAEIVHKFELTHEETEALRGELMKSIRLHFRSLMHTREEGAADHIMDEYLYTHKIIGDLSAAFSITYEEFAREADLARQIFEERRT